ncbi:MAG: adenylyltransferase/cytidyltransferase family protein [Prolixibacteraceae bacterium]|jgi:cytidyltransferase-like protein|nr:adenylyltransferase/cytidyltransferase family protein [Prolixibacteraceae bacterium]MBT6006931.1 adenylyltransferase/cytidyltransferase family protein [Prolixibacteraceae bacterium]MBT6766571.1 adenylyltransferase/cytidyltransferase family protein [Prolixibacteraceae bacterium]MBT7000743.1 adenylyltransferase/cytidyltransferase family protein [Prolixibacteraceae bacterium]MBT7394881.1 adenylyltransferase/cytidyltransferase family protein [Prolixibacteraceae bacterium]
MSDKIVMVSGCYDLLHAGHVAFFKTAAKYGKLHVYVGQDQNIKFLKGKVPYFSEEERKYIVGAVRYVEKANVASGSGMLDFEQDMKNLKPDIFLVNSDGFTAEKKQLCKENGVELVVLERIPEDGLPTRSSSESKKELKFPYRVCLAGGWMDQPWVSEKHPGSVVVAQIWPTMDFNDRSGMATSSRKVAMELWGDKYPDGDPIRNAQLLFGAENPPGSEYISGSQDHIGLLVSGVSRIDYDGKFWPNYIENTADKETCEWLSNVLNFAPLQPRPEGYNPILTKNLDPKIIKRLGESGENCYTAILKKDVKLLGESMKETFLCWSDMLPYTVPDWVMQEMQTNYFPKYSGAITSGSGGGYVVFPTEGKVEGAIKVKIRY